MSGMARGSVSLHGKHPFQCGRRNAQPPGNRNIIFYILVHSTVSSATINNGTLRNKRLYRFTLGVTYDTSRPQLEQLMTDLTAMLKASPYTYEDSVLVKLNGFGASSIDLLVSAYLRTADMTRFLQMQNDLNLDLMDVMQKNGVDFAFPSTTVYLEKNN